MEEIKFSINYVLEDETGGEFFMMRYCKNKMTKNETVLTWEVIMNLKSYIKLRKISGNYQKLAENKQSFETLIIWPAVNNKYPDYFSGFAGNSRAQNPNIAQTKRANITGVHYLRAYQSCGFNFVFYPLSYLNFTTSLFAPTPLFAPTSATTGVHPPPRSCSCGYKKEVRPVFHWLI